uniref:Uncharacterized protein n=1 Tax=Rhodnius prolixus TaxID=13249 RepID=T1H857_RHOPR
MNMLTILATFCFLIAAVNCRVLKQEDALEKCSKENSIDRELAQKIISHQAHATTPNEKCLIACYLKVKRYLLNHQIDWVAIYKSHAARITDETEKEKVKAIFEECEANSYENKDDCQIAYDAYECKKL